MQKNMNNNTQSAAVASATTQSDDSSSSDSAQLAAYTVSYTHLDNDDDINAVQLINEDTDEVLATVSNKDSKKT